MHINIIEPSTMSSLSQLLYTAYGKTFEGENFCGYKRKHCSPEKFYRLAVSAIV